MPFKSEKQRKYLWANEPEIARDWTDTYGSKIHKADGGRIGFYRGSDRHAGTGSSQSQGSDRGPRDAPDRHGPAPSTRTSHHPGVDRGGYTPTHVKAGLGPKPTPDRDGLLRNLEKKSIDSFVRRNKYKN